jgi:hypothetical protein
MAATESLQNEGFFMTVVPPASNPAAIALCVRLLLGGASFDTEYCRTDSYVH